MHWQNVNLHFVGVGKLHLKAYPFERKHSATAMKPADYRCNTVAGVKVSRSRRRFVLEVLVASPRLVQSKWRVGMRVFLCAQSATIRCESECVSVCDVIPIFQYGITLHHSHKHEETHCSAKYRSAPANYFRNCAQCTAETSSQCFSRAACSFNTAFRSAYCHHTSILSFHRYTRVLYEEQVGIPGSNITPAGANAEYRSHTFATAVHADVGMQLRYDTWDQHAFRFLVRSNDECLLRDFPPQTDK